ncbi:uncharacterized protein [Chelonus insularis]|uniref:uncharacterized protein isoform X2 n=1 Tax=Chelonus insularis TaxID=460826 RepID=UPI00158EB646|nr:uncharacterized protein LOC118063711 isoform X2 [Chelonus insularis]
MEPIKTSQAKCNSLNPGHYARTNRYCVENDNNEENEHNKSSEAYKNLISQHSTWPVKRDTWTGQQINYPDQQNSSTSYNEMASIVNYGENGCLDGRHGQRRLGAKVDVVYSLLGMLGSTDGREDMSATLLAMSNSIDSCLIMRQSGCLPLLIQLIHANGQNPETRERATRALHNVVHARSDEKIGRREARVLRLLEQIRDYCQMLRISLKSERPLDDLERHPGPTIAALMKLSFDEAHRHAMCQLGGLHAVTELIEMDHAVHGSDSDDQSCITLRRYAGMALTNLTFGDGNNKALLCSFREFMKALVSQLRSSSDDLRQVTASVLRNLSWRADSSSKQTLREVGAVTALMRAAMEGRKESTLKSILSALWNLSAHCSTNKVDICAVEGALAFLVDMLSYKAPSKTLSIVENAGGILRNVSSHIALREDYRAIVRERGCLQVLLRQLRSPSLTVVSNACGTLWNLSARCPHDQRLLWDLGAVPMLRSLVHSKHKMISMGSSAALKNLLNARPYGSNLVHLDSTARCLGLPTLPSLAVRRQRALEQEIDQNLSETCDNIEPSTSPTNKEDKFSFKIDSNYEDLTLQRKTYQNHNNQEVLPKTNGVSRSESKESMRSVTSTHSDTIFERVNRYASNELTPNELQSKQQSLSLHSAVSFNAYGVSSQTEKRYALHYKNVIPEQLQLMEIDVNDRNMKSITSTISWAIADDQKSSCSLLQSSVKDKLSLAESTESIANKNSNDYETFGHKLTNYKNSSARSSTDSIVFNESTKLLDKSRFLHASNHKLESDPFGNYAETDLDEPTNYSLRYAERNLDEDEKPRLEYLLENEQPIEDTVKTYYTEGTPHDTSLNPSRATSQSDLQYDKMKQGKSNKKVLESYKKLAQNQLDSLNIKKPDNLKSSINIDSNITNINLAINSETKIINEPYSIEQKVIKKQNGIIELESLTESIASDGDDDDEDLLAACIHIGMQNNRHMQSFRRNISDDDNLHEENNDNCYHLESMDDENKNSKNQNDLTSTKPPSVNKITMNIVDDNVEDKLKSSQGILSQPVSTESFNSVDKSEQVLLELCIKPENPVNNTEEADNQTEKYRRQRDPDAMIASLDRLTATLVQQTEAMREKESITMKQSLHSDSWNEDSPNDSSFPTISMSVPLIASFKSDTQEEMVEVFSNINKDTIMEESNTAAAEIIEAEALKVAEAMTNEFNVNQNTQDLDDIKPPSLMNSILSLTMSFVGTENGDDQRNSTSLPPTLLKSRIFDNHGRKKSLPVSIAAKRSLVKEYVHTGSLENLLNDTSIGNVSQLENVKPPSMMDEILDNGDMENSMLSVASIVSEIADSKNPNSGSSLIHDVNKTPSKHLGSSNNSHNEYLENINPPSLFNVISEIDDTTMDANTETLYSDTLCIDNQLQIDETNVDKNTTDQDVNDNDTDDAATPISTEYSSSAESTPKKIPKKQQVTPKQRRQLAKERYRTYTIAAKLIKKEGNDGAKKDKFETQINRTKLTPKQRRQEDPSRFQTQILHSIPKASLIPSPKTVVSTKVSLESESQIISNENNIVLFALNDSTKADKSLLDCETLNLVTNNLETEKDPQRDAGDVDRQTSENNSDVNNKMESTEASENSESENENQIKEKVLKRPRIIKPKIQEAGEDNCEEKSPSNSPKAIRGRRKALYSNPNKKVSSTPATSAHINISGGRTSVSPMVRNTRASTLKQNVMNDYQTKSGVTQKISSTVKNMTVNKRSSIPQRKSSTSLANKSAKNLNSSADNGSSGHQSTQVPKPLERQNTFTKDEPEMENVPSVVPASPSKSKIAKPVRGSMTKISSTKSKIAAKTGPQQSKLTKCVSAERIASPKGPSTVVNKRYSGTESKILSSNINTNTKIPKKPINLGQRSNSNSSIVASSSELTKKLTKETTSKVATLWKKVDENRNKRFQKCKSEQSDTGAAELSSGTKTVSHSPTRLFRSSTFNGITTDVDADCQGIDQDSCDLTGSSTGDVPCKIPVRCSSSKVNEKFDNRTVVMRKDHTETSQNNQIKRISRLGSFISVDSPGNTDNIQIPTINYSSRSKLSTPNAIKTNESGDITASHQVMTA